MSRGSTLIEVLITISLLGIVAAGVFSFYATGIFTNQRAADLAVATGLAQARMERLIANPYDTRTNGHVKGVDLASAEGYHWTVEIAPIAPGLSQGTVTVWWAKAGRRERVTLTTLVRTQETP